jgi:hypothetical protein
VIIAQSYRLRKLMRGRFSFAKNIRRNMNNEQSRFIRWGIPGWMMFLAFISYSIIDILLSPESEKNGLGIFLKKITGNITSNAPASAVVVLLVAAAGIPLGFFIYQLYFYVRWNSPFSRDGLLPPFIVGRWDDLNRTLTGVKTENIIGDDAWRLDWTKNPLYEIDHGWKWRYIENYFIQIVQTLDSRQNELGLFTRYRYLMDLLHTLGAGLFGIYLGYLGYLFAKVKADSISLTILILVTVITLAPLIRILEKEDSIKRGSEIIDPVVMETKQLIIRPFKFFPFIQLSNPSVIYLFFLFALLYLGSPSPYINQATVWLTIFRTTLLILFMFAWWFSKRKNILASIRWSETCLIALLIIISLQISQWLINWDSFHLEWWNIGWSILIFLITNTIFIKNRQNTRDDLIAMQNYTIKRYLSLEKQKSEGSPKSEAKPVKDTLLKLINRLWF